MARIIIQRDPLNGIAPDVYHVKPGGTLVDWLSVQYPDGFPCETKVFLNGPAEENEISLEDYAGTGMVLDSQIIWIVHFPNGIETLILVTVVSLVAGLVLGSLISSQIPEVPAPEDLERTRPGVGNSSNNNIAAQTNQIRLGEKIPQIYGRVRSFPDIINDAYNTYSLQGVDGADFTGQQTLKQYFVISEGNVTLSNPRIGDQSLEQSASVMLHNPGDTFDYDDFISGFDTDRVELLTDELAGNSIQIDDRVFSGTNRDLRMEVTTAGITLFESRPSAPSEEAITPRMFYGFLRASRSLDVQVRSDFTITDEIFVTSERWATSGQVPQDGSGALSEYQYIDTGYWEITNVRANSLWIGYGEAPDACIFKIEINGSASLVNEVPKTGGGDAEVDSYSPGGNDVDLLIATGLPDIDLTVRLTIVGQNPSSSDTRLYLSKSVPDTGALATSGDFQGTFNYQENTGFSYDETEDELATSISGANVSIPTGTVSIPGVVGQAATEKVFIVPPTEGEILGNVDLADLSDLSDKTPIAVNQEYLIPFVKRTQPDDVDSQRVIANISYPEGFDVRPVDANFVITPSVTVEVWEVDSSGNFISQITSSFQSARGRSNPFSATYSVDLSGGEIVPGRFIGAKLRGVFNPSSLQSLFLFNAFADGKDASAIFRGDLVNAGVNDIRLGYSNDDVAIAEVIRTAKPGDERRPTGKFNIEASRSIPIFDPSVGTFGAEAFTQDFAEIFMHHAVTVGRIPLNQINYDELFDIRDSLDTNDREFNYTFSSKNTPLDQELATICNAARVTMYKEGSTYRFARDEARVKVGNLTSRNVTLDNNAKSISLSTPNTNDGIEFEYIDPSTNKAAVIYVPSDRSALRPKKIKSAGIKNYTQAWRRAQYEYLRLFSQRIVRSVSTTKEGYLWDLMSRVTVYDHTRLSIKPLTEAQGFFRQETEIKSLTAGVFVGSEKLISDGTMAAEFYFDDETVSSYQGILIDIDPVDPRRFTIADSVDTATRDAILANTRTIAQGNQVGEKVLIYPVTITDSQLIADDYLIIRKQPEGERVNLELIRYNPDLYQFDDQEPPA